MFNPYVSDPSQALRPVERDPEPKPAGAIPAGILDRLLKLDRDDILIGLLVYLLAREGDGDGIWPLVAVMLYLLL